LIKSLLSSLVRESDRKRIFNRWDCPARIWKRVAWCC